MPLLDKDELLLTLEKAIPEILEAHKDRADDWLPHNYIPWADGKNFEFLGGTDWDPTEQGLTEEVRAGVLALLLNKDNLPSLHRVLTVQFPPFNEWGPVVGIFTAEQTRHAIALRDFIVVTRLMDPQEAEDRRLPHITQGFMQTDSIYSEISVSDLLALMALLHIQTDLYIAELRKDNSDGVLDTILAKIGYDDATIAQLFAEFLSAALTADPQTSVTSIAKVIDGLEPVGADIVNFAAEQALIAKYQGPEAISQAIARLVELVKLESVSGLDADAEAARQKILAAAR